MSDYALAVSSQKFHNAYKISDDPNDLMDSIDSMVNCAVRTGDLDVITESAKTKISELNKHIDGSNKEKINIYLKEKMVQLTGFSNS